ncbi:MAG TPA: hypothetical protein ENF22_00730 [Chloroflexi bacterium]|nr:hypothetical protein [Chloroflexota bacterium]
MSRKAKGYSWVGSDSELGFDKTNVLNRVSRQAGALVTQGWHPQEGDTQVNIFYVTGVHWPVLLITQEGVLFPRFKPKRTGEYA